MSSLEVGRLTRLVNVIRDAKNIDVFDLRRRSGGMSIGIYNTLKPVLESHPNWIWQVRYSKENKSWKYIGDEIREGDNQKHE